VTLPCTWLGMGTGSAACQQLQGLRRRQATDKALADRIEQIRSGLEALG